MYAPENSRNSHFSSALKRKIIGLLFSRPRSPPEGAAIQNENAERYSIQA